MLSVLQKSEWDSRHEAAGHALEATQQSSSLPALADARQLIVAAVEHLQVCDGNDHAYMTALPNYHSRYMYVCLRLIVCVKKYIFPCGPDLAQSPIIHEYILSSFVHSFLMRVILLDSSGPASGKEFQPKNCVPFQQKQCTKL